MPDALPDPVAVGPEPDPPVHVTRRATVYSQLQRMVVAIRNGDDAMVESAILSLSQRSRWLAPLALVVGAFAMLFQGVKLLVTNWRLTLIQILPAMWIWAAMLDLKLHVLQGKSLRIIEGPVLIPIILGIAAITAAAYFLNAVFAFAMADPGHPEIRPAFARARAPPDHRSRLGVRDRPGALGSPPWSRPDGAGSGLPSS